MESIPIREAIGRRKTVPVTSDIIESAREIGISFGDLVLDGGYQDFDFGSSYSRSNFLFRPHR